MKAVVRISISGVALALLVLHLLYPRLGVDAVTLGLLITAVLPWLSEVIESASFPGGWEIKFKDVATAGQKVAGGVVPAANTEERPSADGRAAAQVDPNLALVGLRIDLERRLRTIAELSETPLQRNLRAMVRELQHRDVLDEPEADGIAELIQAGNSAAHGARVEPSVATWAAEFGPEVLKVLDEHIERLRP